MSEERELVLNMLKEGKIEHEHAVELLKALGEDSDAEQLSERIEPLKQVIAPVVEVAKQHVSEVLDDVISETRLRGIDVLRCKAEKIREKMRKKAERREYSARAMRGAHKNAENDELTSLASELEEVTREFAAELGNLARVAARAADASVDEVSSALEDILEHVEEAKTFLSEQERLIRSVCKHVLGQGLSDAESV